MGRPVRRAGLLLAAMLLVACGTGVESQPPGASGSPPGTPLPVPSSLPPASARPTTGTALAEFPVPPGSHPHDVAPALDGGVWYTAQLTGKLGLLDPATGDVREFALGDGSRPHGVIVGPDGAPWVTDGGRNAIVRIDPGTAAVTEFPLPGDFANANLNTATFDGDGVLWFTGQSGVYGRLDPGRAEPRVEAWEAPRGRGPYGIATTPDGEVWFVSLAGSYLARVDRATGDAVVIDSPTPGQGARRVWADPDGRLFVAEWNAGQVAMHDPSDGSWLEWRLPGPAEPQPYAVFVDDRGIAWLTDFGNNAIVRFDPSNETFSPIRLPDAGAAVRQLHGRPGEVWGAESGLDRLVVVRTERAP